MSGKAAVHPKRFLMLSAWFGEKLCWNLATLDLGVNAFCCYLHEFFGILVCGGQDSVEHNRGDTESCVIPRLCRKCLSRAGGGAVVQTLADVFASL